MRQPSRRLALVVTLLALIAGRSTAATYTWNSAGTDWATAANWTPAGPPDSPDVALFSPNGSAGVTVQNPSIASSSAVLSLTLAPNQLFGGWTVGGSGSLAIGGTGSTGLTSYGPATYTFSGPTFQGA